MLYERKIKYFDYYESGVRVSGGGFAKLELKDGKMCLDITVRGLYPTDSFSRDVLLQNESAEVLLGQIDVQNGKGFFQYTAQPGAELSETGLSWQTAREIRISIGGNRELVCPLEEASRICKGGQQENRPAEIPQIVPAAGETQKPAEKLTEKPEEQMPAEKLTEKPEEQMPAGEMTEKPKEQMPAEKMTEIPEEQKLTEKMTKVSEGKITAEASELPEVSAQSLEPEEPPIEEVQAKEASAEERKAIETMRSGVRLAEHTNEPDSVNSSASDACTVLTKKGKAREKLMEDKWQQLSAIYPHVRPFRDKRDYLSIRPADFVLFPSKYYKAANNSFLLHGYYNYDHLILARMQSRGEPQYYIGVPGNYYDREKQVAVMFGFESFECASEPAQTGDFGYYMMRTEL